MSLAPVDKMEEVKRIMNGDRRMLEVMTCSSCHRVHKYDEWQELTALDILSLKARAGEWEVRMTLCDECRGKSGSDSRGGSSHGSVSES